VPHNVVQHNNLQQFTLSYPTPDHHSLTSTFISILSIVTMSALSWNL